VNVLRKEEEMFLHTLDKGLSKFKRLAAKAKDGVISGKDAWVLSDTYGFPLDLTVWLSVFYCYFYYFPKKKNIGRILMRAGNHGGRGRTEGGSRGVQEVPGARATGLPGCR
jgi:hypothetical protein